MYPLTLLESGSLESRCGHKLVITNLKIFVCVWYGGYYSQPKIYEVPRMSPKVKYVVV